MMSCIEGGERVGSHQVYNLVGGGSGKSPWATTGYLPLETRDGWTSMCVLFSADGSGELELDREQILNGVNTVA
jgi:hypothetical protein